MYENLISKSQWLRKTVFKMCVEKGQGHIPSCFSMIEIIISIYYGGIAKVYKNDPNNNNRDRIFVSKGHAAMTQYPILAEYGFFPSRELEKYTQPGGILGLYANSTIPGIEGISGSLGHALGIGAGISLNSKRENSNIKSYVILGDGECYEGSVWESAMFAAHHKLDNLITIIDKNKLCMLGRTEDLLSQGDLASKWESFGWHVENVNGHSYKSIMKGFSNIKNIKGKPIVIIADTVKGKGVSFMEGQNLWHNRIPNKEQATQAESDLNINPIVD